MAEEQENKEIEEFFSVRFKDGFLFSAPEIRKYKKQVCKLFESLGFKRKIISSLNPLIGRIYSLDDTLLAEVKTESENDPGSKEHWIEPYSATYVKVGIKGNYEKEKAEQILQKLHEWCNFKLDNKE